MEEKKEEQPDKLVPAKFPNVEPPQRTDVPINYGRPVKFDPDPAPKPTTRTFRS